VAPYAESCYPVPLAYTEAAWLPRSGRTYGKIAVSGLLGQHHGVGRHPVILLVMKLKVALIVMILLLLGLVVDTEYSLQRAPDSVPVYTVAQVVTGLAHNPRKWIGRTVLVRGSIIQIDSVSVPPASPLSPHDNPLYPPVGIHVQLVLATRSAYTGGTRNPFDVQPKLIVRPNLPRPTLNPLERFAHYLSEHVPIPNQFVPQGLQLRTGSIFQIKLLSRHRGTCAPLGMCDDALLVGERT